MMTEENPAGREYLKACFAAGVVPSAVIVESSATARRARATAMPKSRPRQVSFTAARQALCAGLEQGALSRPAERRRLGEVLLGRLGQEQVGDRPGRVEPRATKRPPKGYPRLRQPRAQARARLQR